MVLKCYRVDSQAEGAALCILRAQYSGNATDSKPVNVGSIPAVRVIIGYSQIGIWQAESQSGTGSIPVVLVLLYLLYVSTSQKLKAYNNT